MSDERKRPQAIQVSTRPEDWAAPTRAHLFGLDSLTPQEFAIEGTRMSGGRPKYGDEVFERAAAMRLKHRT
jgi:hypothetical protein